MTKCFITKNANLNMGSDFKGVVMAKQVVIEIGKRVKVLDAISNLPLYMCTYLDNAKDKCKRMNWEITKIRRG